MEWLNYNHLFYFYRAAQEGGISAAARALHVSQPTVSAQIKALEDEFGVRLFDRTPGGMRLTESGARLWSQSSSTGIPSASASRHAVSYWGVSALRSIW